MYLNLDLGNLILFLIVGLAAGFVANALLGKRESSLLSNMLLGLAGAFVGGLVLPAIGFRFWGIAATFISATVGAVLILFLTRLISGNKTFR